MEFTIDAVANKMIMVLLGLAVLVALGGLAFFRSYEAIPFAIGAGMAAFTNVVRVVWLKKTINKSVEMETPKGAKYFFQIHYFLRIVFTGVMLLIAALAPDNIVNLLGVIIGILTFPVAMRLMQLFIPPDAPMTTPQPVKEEGEE